MSNLIPVEQFEIKFYNDQITAVLVSTQAVDTLYIPLRPLVESIGLDWSGQRRRIKRDPILNEVCRSVVVTATHLAEDDTRPRRRSMLAVPLDYVDGFLMGVNADRVDPSLRERLLAYQRECYQALSKHFGRQDMAQLLRGYYGRLGRQSSWIETRLRNMVAYRQLVDRWIEAGVTLPQQHERLLAIISTEAFEVTPEQHRTLKGLPDEEALQDHMTRVELLIEQLGEETALGIEMNEAPKEMTGHEAAAKRGGDVARQTRQRYEQETGQKVVTGENFLTDGKKRPLPEGEEE